MKTLSYKETERLLWDVADLAAKDWFRQASREPFAEFYLWWRKAHKGEQVSLPIVSKDKPNEGYFQSIRISSFWSSRQAMLKIREAMQTLPILET